MAIDLTQSRITAEEKQEIKDKSPEVLPLNPTSQGWSGQQVRRQLSRYVTDEQQSVLALMSEKFDIVSNYLGTLESLAGGSLNILEVIYTEEIEKGDLLQVDSTSGQSGKILVKKARNTGEDSVQKKPELVVGVAIQSGITDDLKEILTGGVYLGLDTSDYTESSLLYIDPSTLGGLTTTKPSSPNNKSVMGLVIYSHESNGIILFNPIIKQNMSDIQEVDMTGISEGDVLKYDATAKVFKPGKAQGIFYTDDLPAEEERYVNLTFFDTGS